MEEKMVNCGVCGNLVPESNLDMLGIECLACRAYGRANDMGVGDINTK